MKGLCLVLLGFFFLSGCRQHDSSAVDNSQVEVESTSSVEEGASDQAPLDASFVEGVSSFDRPLPSGVVFDFPYNSRLDVSALGQDGTVGRRVEFEFFSRDANAAMESVSLAMRLADFVPGELKVDAGVVRQTFSKAGYGTVNARSQLDAVSKDHDAAIGYVVMAWPKDDSAQ